MGWTEEEKKKFEDFLKAGDLQTTKEKAAPIFNNAREMLLKKITPADLDWKTVRLDGHTVQVCAPVSVIGPDNKRYYVPVRPSEAWNFARHFNALPLTSLVFDLYHNQSTHIDRSGKHDASQVTGSHFHTFSAYLNEKQYHLGMKAGAHKLWILSAAGRSVNRGFYFPKPKDPVKYKKKKSEGGLEGPGGPGGPKLDPSYWLIQVRGTAHKAEHDHWDYSQLLQLMRSEDLFGVGMDFENSAVSFFPFPSVKVWRLREAVYHGHPAVWDEGKPLAELKNNSILP
jgi:hypothetical protein